MKKTLSILLVAVMLFSFTACKSAPPAGQMENTLKQFVDAMKEYDRDTMSGYLTSFPDNNGYVYLDDVFNDEAYVRIYRNIYKDISYDIVSIKNNQIVIEAKMPNVQKLYTDVSTAILSLVLSDEELQEKLNESEENGVVLIQEAMYSFVLKGNYETMTQQFTLTFDDKEGRPVIVCDDELRAFITGNFFLSKNMTQAEIN